MGFDKKGKSDHTITEKKPNSNDSYVSNLKTKCITRQYKQTYRKAWEMLPDFKGWLQAVQGQPSRAFCSYCKKILSAHRLTLLKHTCTSKHVTCAQQMFKELEESKSKIKSNVLPINDSVTNFDLPIIVETVELEISNNESYIVEDNLLQSNQAEENNLEISSLEVQDSSPVTVSVFDTAKGTPCPSLQLSLYKLIDGKWTHCCDSFTNPVGRCEHLISTDNLTPGRFKLHFDVHRYYELRNQDTAFPFVEIAFDVRSSTENYHISLLLSPYGYTTYCSRENK